MSADAGPTARPAPERSDRSGARFVYDFPEGSRHMRELLGGKGAGAAEMTRVLGAERVPAGFTITTEACVAYMRGRIAPSAGRAWPRSRSTTRWAALAGAGGKEARRQTTDPLLVSVRSGARESMPGMLDTVLNLGLNDRIGRGGWPRSTEQRPVRLGQLPALRADVRQPCAAACRGEAIEDAIAEASSQTPDVGA